MINIFIAENCSHKELELRRNGTLLLVLERTTLQFYPLVLQKRQPQGWSLVLLQPALFAALGICSGREQKRIYFLFMGSPQKTSSSNHFRMTVIHNPTCVQVNSGKNGHHWAMNKCPDYEIFGNAHLSRSSTVSIHQQVFCVYPSDNHLRTCTYTTSITREIYYNILKEV